MSMKTIFNESSIFFWDIGDETKQLIELINGSFLSTLISVLGIIGSAINIAVFYKQGPGSSINISFALLALSELCGLLTLLWYTICGNPFVLKYEDTIFYFPEVKHLTAGFPHGCFYGVTSWITVFIMAERCLCVAFPLNVKKLITPRRTKITIFCIYLLMFLSMAPQYACKYLDWKFVPRFNRSYIGLIIIEESRQIEDVSSALFSSYMISSFLAVPTLTSTLLVLYSSSAKWRYTNADRKKVFSSRDRSLVKIVLVEGFIFSASYSVSVLVLMMNILLPEFNYVGRMSNLFFVCFSFTFLFDAFNSSIHFVLYLKMSSNYRATLRELFKVFSVRGWEHR
uniref:G-protein coupled receptors family 1 profile domain-containing protein n=1 Tax=Biomphalaria glabrata TaxID=6526 RepID=A0A2C9KY51_BIOGL